jgi:hypothetical protein
MKNLYFLLFFIMSASLNGQDTVFVDADKIIGPALQPGSGFLTGYNDTITVHDSLLLPIKCRFQRGNLNVIIANYKRNRSIGCSMELNLSSGWDRKILPGDNGNWKPWEEHVAGIVNDLKSRGMTEDMSFSIWDNPDLGRGFWPSAEHYFEAWCRAQKQVKALLPSAMMVGPSSENGNPSYWWPSIQTSQNWTNWGTAKNSDDNTYYVRQFLDYTIARGCTPDIVSRHDHYKDGRYIESDDARLRQYYASKGIAPIPFEQDDVGARYTGGPEQFNPGHYVDLFAAIERVKVLRSCKCCWDNDCGTSSLNGLVTKDTRQKRSLWWTYKAYADVTGQILFVTRGNNADAVAGWDTVDNKLRIIIGRNAATTEPVTVVVRNVKANSINMTITGCSIPNSKADIAPRPAQTLKRTTPVIDGKLTFDITDLGEYGAYSIEISGLVPATIDL